MSKAKHCKQLHLLATMGFNVLTYENEGSNVYFVNISKDLFKVSSTVPNLK